MLSQDIGNKDMDSDLCLVARVYKIGMINLTCLICYIYFRCSIVSK